MLSIRPVPIEEALYIHTGIGAARHPPCADASFSRYNPLSGRDRLDPPTSAEN